MRFFAISNILDVSTKQLFDINKIDVDFCIFLGDIPEKSICSISKAAECNSYLLLGENDKSLSTSCDVTSLHNSIAHINGQTIGGFQASQDIYNKKNISDHDVLNELKGAHTLFTHHSPFVKINAAGIRTSPTYINDLIEIVQPKSIIYGRSSQNAIGSLQKYKCDIVKTIGIYGIVFMEIDHRAHIKQFIVY